MLSLHLKLFYLQNIIQYNQVQDCIRVIWHFSMTTQRGLAQISPALGIFTVGNKSTQSDAHQPTNVFCMIIAVQRVVQSCTAGEKHFCKLLFNDSFITRNKKKNVILNNQNTFKQTPLHSAPAFIVFHKHCFPSLPLCRSRGLLVCVCTAAALRDLKKIKNKLHMDQLNLETKVNDAQLKDSHMVFL